MNTTVAEEIKTNRLTAPRVTPQSIEDLITSEHYFTAAQGVLGSGGQVMCDDDELRCLTFCVLVLRKGFSVTGESACTIPEDFKAEQGRMSARENAINKVLTLEGFPA